MTEEQRQRFDCIGDCRYCEFVECPLEAEDFLLANPKLYRVIYNQALEDFKVSLEKHQQENWIDNLEYGITFADVESVIDELKK